LEENGKRNVLVSLKPLLSEFTCKHTDITECLRVMMDCDLNDNGEGRSVEGRELSKICTRNVVGG
jgi:hypothetical protein